ncbi:MAG: winged helix-turn-helix transcriptional regulator [Streptococcus sp.]|nr:winged helix-turn-helix transcriptional regulator [Streptococcus sp.]
MNYKETMSRLNKALNNIDSAYAKIAKKHGLTFNSLMMLYLLEESKKITQKQICDTLHLPKSTVHSILSDFIKQQYVTLVAGSNKKEKFVVFTEAGRGFFSKIFEETDRFEEKVLSLLGEDTCSFLIETAEKLSGIIKDEIAEISDSEV